MLRHRIHKQKRIFGVIQTVHTSEVFCLSASIDRQNYHMRYNWFANLALLILFFFKLEYQCNVNTNADLSATDIRTKKLDRRQLFAVKFERLKLFRTVKVWDKFSWQFDGYMFCLRIHEMLLSYESSFTILWRCYPNSKSSVEFRRWSWNFFYKLKRTKIVMNVLIFIS